MAPFHTWLAGAAGILFLSRKAGGGLGGISPLKVKCWSFGFSKKDIKDLKIPRKERKFCQWSCIGKLKAAHFENRKWDETLILHGSTKSKGKWQMSRFDKDGPYSDSQYSSCEEAVKELSPMLWKLKKVVA